MKHRIVAALVLSAVFSSCGGRLKEGDFFGSYSGQWSAGDTGTLELRADRTYVWTPDKASAVSQRHSGTYKVDEIDGVWYLGLSRLDAEGHCVAIYNPSFAVVAGHIFSLVFDSDSAYVLKRK